MGATAARKAAAIVANTGRILAIELLAACEALEFLTPLCTSKPLDAVYRRVRSEVAPHEVDRVLGTEIEAIAELVRDGTLLAAAGGECGTLD
jgi:histidine ammonia-lyase